MKKLVAVRDYRFTDAHLVVLTDEKLDSALRDAVEFADRGYDATRLNQIRTLRQAFAVLPSDHYLDGLRQIATKHKNDSREALEAMTRTIQLAAKHVFKDNRLFSIFGETGLSRMSDGQFVHNSEDVYRAAQANLTSLDQEGITAAKLADYEALKIDFYNKFALQRQAQNTRDIATENRIKNGNELYTHLANLCEVGKDIWYTKNEAKYNDYLVYDTPTTVTTTPETNTIAPGATKAFFKNQIDRDSRIEVKVSDGLGKLLLYASIFEQNPVPINAVYADLNTPMTVTIGDISTAGIVDTFFVHNGGSETITFDIQILA